METFDEFKSRDDVEFVDLKEFPENAGSLRQLRELVAVSKATDVIHVDADSNRFFLAFSPFLLSNARHHLVIIFTEFIDWRSIVSPIEELFYCIKIVFSGSLRKLFLRDRAFSAEKLPRMTRFVICWIFRIRKNINVFAT
ncbi:MAG: hypothetical protein AAF212_09715, partial [Verrucomicrobiota bacterium]